MTPGTSVTVTRGEPQPQVIDVLVLDDSRFDAMFIQRECRRTELPVRVSIAPDMAKFREMLSKRPYHLVFIDYLLPDGDGLAAREMMKDGSQNESAPVVMISGEARHDVAVEAMKGGCIDYKAKSDLTPDALRQLILRALEVGAQVNKANLQEALDAQRQDIVSAMRDVIRQELGISGQKGESGQIREVLQSYGMIAEDGDTDWEEIFRNPATNFVFRTH
ncbi:response regulator [Pseudooceanicola algae]|nr:response regulator [Pseudooceanicola algae]